MAKNKGGDFQNRAAKRFKTPDKVDLMPQQEIFEIFDEDIETILDQVTAARNHTGKYPVYVTQNAFVNLSTPLWFSLYVKDHCKVKKGKLKTDLSEDQIESLKSILADAYKKSATNQYSQQTQEFKDRNKIIGKTFIILSPKVYMLTKKLKLTKSQRRDLTIQIYGDPVNNMRFIHKLFNHSPISEEKKLKLCKKMYGKNRFIDAVGAAMTVDSNTSDFLVTLYEYMMSKKTKKRAPFVLAYARAYKKNKSSNYRLSGGEFYKKNRKLIKELKSLDIGFKKAFKNLKPKKDGKDSKSSKKDRSVKFSIS
jgi:hypothetical protein